MKGIVLAGGSGTGLYPSTIATSKQLLNIYDKPLVYYPISVLMLAGIKDILIISTPEELPNFKKLLGDGSQFGIKFSYKEQSKPEGIAQAFIIGEKFIGNDNVVLILGDNIFYGHKFSDYLQKAAAKKTGATVFIHKVDNPKQYGVVEFDENNNIKVIEEKPENPKSNYVVTGLYFYDSKAIEYAKSLKPSQRNELEISDLNNKYLENKELNAEILGRGFSWFDTGTHRSIIQASQYVQAIEDGQGNKIACLEEIAINMEFIDKEQVRQNISKYLHNDYYKYVLGIINNE